MIVGGVGGGHRVVLVPADSRLEHPRAVHRELDVVRLEETADRAQVGLQQLRLEDVDWPSSGNVWRASMPPRVPSGSPSTCSLCDASPRTM